MCSVIRFHCLASEIRQIILYSLRRSKILYCDRLVNVAPNANALAYYCQVLVAKIWNQQTGLLKDHQIKDSAIYFFLSLES